MPTSYTTPGVYVEEVPSSSGTLTSGPTAVAAFIGFTKKVPKSGYKPGLVTNWSQFEREYGGFLDGALLPISVHGFFLNGGSLAYIVPIPHTEPSSEPGQLALPTSDKKLNDGKAVEFTALQPGKEVDVSISSSPASADEEGAPPAYQVVVDGPEGTEVYNGVTLADIGDKVNSESKMVKVETKADLSGLEAVVQTIPTGTFTIEPATPTHIQVKVPAFSGSESGRTGIGGLSLAEEVTMVMVPDLETAARKDDGSIDMDMWKSVQLAVINHCEQQKNRMAVLDAPPELSPQEVLEWRQNDAGYSSAFAALYYPRIEVDNPTNNNGKPKIFVPPSGHLAGIWARNDEERGVHKAPANEIVRGALSVETEVNKAEQGLLNPEGINCIRPFKSQGIRVWGARTLDSVNDDWKYINVRRLFNTIETAILNGTSFAVFEPNDKTLWEGLKRTVNSYLTGMWRDGALFGATAEQAFYVKCDEETNPQDQIDKGMVVVEVGIAPVKPAEFVIFRVAQHKGETA